MKLNKTENLNFPTTALSARWVAICNPDSPFSAQSVTLPQTSCSLLLETFRRLTVSYRLRYNDTPSYSHTGTFISGSTLASPLTPHQHEQAAQLICTLARTFLRSPFPNLLSCKFYAHFSRLLVCKSPFLSEDLPHCSLSRCPLFQVTHLTSTYPLMHCSNTTLHLSICYASAFEG